MIRKNAFTIQITDTSSPELGALLNDDNICEGSKLIQPELNRWFIFWFENPPIELFKFADHFDWISGPSKLWLNEKPFTISDFKINIGDEENPEYKYIDWELLSNVAPIIEDLIE